MNNVKSVGGFLFFLLCACCFTATAQGGLLDYKAAKAEYERLPGVFACYVSEYQVCQTAYSAVEAATSQVERAAKMAVFKSSFEALNLIEEDLGRIGGDLASIYFNHDSVLESGWTEEQWLETKDWLESMCGYIIKMDKRQRKGPSYNKMESLLWKESLFP